MSEYAENREDGRFSVFYGIGKSSQSNFLDLLISEGIFLLNLCVEIYGVYKRIILSMNLIK